MGAADTVDAVVDGLLGRWGVLPLGRRLAGSVGRPSAAATTASAPSSSTHGLAAHLLELPSHRTVWRAPGITSGPYQVYNEPQEGQGTPVAVSERATDVN